MPCFVFIQFLKLDLKIGAFKTIWDRCRRKLGPVKLRLLSLVFPGNNNLSGLDLPGN